MEFGVGTGYFTSLYKPIVNPLELILIDIAAQIPEVTVMDAETQLVNIAPASIDVIAAASALQWLNSPQAFIHKSAALPRNL